MGMLFNCTRQFIKKEKRPIILFSQVFVNACVCMPFCNVKSDTRLFLTFGILAKVFIVSSNKLC